MEDGRRLTFEDERGREEGKSDCSWSYILDPVDRGNDVSPHCDVVGLGRCGDSDPGKDSNESEPGYGEALREWKGEVSFEDASR